MQYISTVGNGGRREASTNYQGPNYVAYVFVFFGTTIIVDCAN